jgi:tRNA (guanine37-N1)-methyltransferase
MLTFHVITLFPDLITLYCGSSILGRGQTGKWFAVRTYNPRDFCTDKYRKVDDTPYGGGAGMVMKVEPIFATLESIKRKEGSPVILTTPRGHTLNQPEAQGLAYQDDITIICGHYEGIDERVRSIVTHEISIGDFVLTGGELPALAIVDAVGRLIPGVLGQAASLADESFTHGVLEAPQYTKPAEFRDMSVPEVLRSGNHKAVERWRRIESLKLTLERRPDLLEKATLDDADKQLIKQLKNGGRDH